VLAGVRDDPDDRQAERLCKLEVALSWRDGHDRAVP
jgi:hypothetical protein